MQGLARVGTQEQVVRALDLRKLVGVWMQGLARMGTQEQVVRALDLRRLVVPVVRSRFSSSSLFSSETSPSDCFNPRRGGDCSSSWASSAPKPRLPTVSIRGGGGTVQAAGHLQLRNLAFRLFQSKVGGWVFKQLGQLTDSVFKGEVRFQCHQFQLHPASKG